MEKVTEIYKTESFTVHPHPKPFVSREEGGRASPRQAIEYIRLYSMMGEALYEAPRAYARGIF